MSTPTTTRGKNRLPISLPNHLIRYNFFSFFFFSFFSRHSSLITFFPSFFDLIVTTCASRGRVSHGVFLCPDAQCHVRSVKQSLFTNTEGRGEGRRRERAAAASRTC